MSDYMLEKKPSPRPPIPGRTTPPTTNATRVFDHRCVELNTNYDVAIATICAMLLVFGIVYSLFGYRCFKAVMFLTGFLFGSVVVYLISLEEELMPPIGNAMVAVGAGILFGLITMLVEYVGLFMTGFHTGLLTGVVIVATLDFYHKISSVWATVGILLGCGVICAISNLCCEKFLTILGTSMYGGAVMAAAMDYFIEHFLMLEWVWDRIKLERSPQPCWFSWLIVTIWPFMIVLGTFTQFCITGRGIYHQQMLPTKKHRAVVSSANRHQRLRQRESMDSLRQRRYRYLYQIRTQHGDVLTQSYIQSLQRKLSPARNSYLTAQSDTTTLSTTLTTNPRTTGEQNPWPPPAPNTTDAYVGTTFTFPPVGNTLNPSDSANTTLTQLPWDRS